MSATAMVEVISKIMVIFYSVSVSNGIQEEAIWFWRLKNGNVNEKVHVQGTDHILTLNNF